jgi:hypothetical protein
MNRAPRSIAVLAAEETIVPLFSRFMPRDKFTALSAWLCNHVCAVEKCGVIFAYFVFTIVFAIAHTVTELIFGSLKPAWMAEKDFPAIGAADFDSLFLSFVLAVLAAIVMLVMLEIPVSLYDRLTAGVAIYNRHRSPQRNNQKATILQGICLSCLGKGSSACRIVALWRQIKNCPASLDSSIVPQKGAL